MVLKRPALSLFKLATLNVRGLTSNVKRQHLAADIDSYGVDFCSLQELKTTQAFDQVISNGGKSFRLISFGQDSGKHGGLGFVMSPRVEPFLVQHKRLSDRVGFADFKFPRNPNAKNKKTIYSMCTLSQLTVLPVHRPRLIKRSVKGSMTIYQLRGVRQRGERCFCMRVISTAQ